MSVTLADVSVQLPDRFNLAHHCLARQVEATPDKVALIVVADAGDIASAERWTYAALDDAVRRVGAGLLDAGLKPGDRVLLRLPNTSDYALLFFGAIAAGLVPVPISAQLTDAETTDLLADASAAAVAETGSPPERIQCLVLDPPAIARLKQAIPLAGYADTLAEAPAYMVYTSGTGSHPKGVIHAQRSVLGRIPMYADWEGLGPDDVMLHAGAFNWSFTLGVGLIDPWAVGATAVLYSGPREPGVWPRLIAATGATLFAAVPSVYRQMLKYADMGSANLSRLRHALAAGEALSPALLGAWQTATGKELYEAFGMSECSTFVSNRPGSPVKPGSPGRPQTGRRITAIPLEGSDDPLPRDEVGLLAIHRSDPGLMLGYWRRPEDEAHATRGEWFVSGDLAAFDADGYLSHHGRADDIIKPGGYRISPLEIEAALADCPGVADIAVGEYRPQPDVAIIAAYVVRAEDVTVGADAILTHAAGRLAAYKRPRQIFFVDALPRTANGKLLRRALPGLVSAPAHA